LKKIFSILGIIFVGIIVIFILFAILCYCLSEGWAYYYFDVLAKCSPALVGGVTYWIWSRNRDYKNDYYKIVLEKRFKVIELLESFTASLRISTVGDKDKKPYHVVFSTKEGILDETLKAMEIKSKSLWLTSEINDLLVEMNQLMYLFPEENNGILQYAKDNYEKIAILREKIDCLIAKEMLNLYDIGGFLKKRSEQKHVFCKFEIK